MLESLPRARYYLLGSLFLLLWFAALGTRGLFSPDEGRYGLIAHEMLVSGDWVTPHLNDLVYLEKPPLQYWMTAIAYRVIGEGEFATRLWPALCGLATIALSVLWAWRRSGPLGALACGCILASNLLFFLFAQVATLDMGLTLFLLLGLAAFMQAERPAESRKAILLWQWAGWGALALAVLSKGLIGLVLPAFTVAVYTLITRDWRLPLRLQPLSGLVILFIVCGPWFIAAQRANPEFFNFFIIHEHFARFGTAAHQRTGAWWYFLAVALLGLLPWTAFCARERFWRSLGRLSTWQAWRSTVARHVDPKQAVYRVGFNEPLFMVLWIVCVIGFFSLSHSKLPAYVVPAFPLIAVLAGGVIARSQQDSTQLAVRAWPGLVLAVVLALSILILRSSGVDDVSPQLMRRFTPLGLTSAALLAIANVGAILLFRRARIASALLVMGTLSLAGWQVLLTGATVFEEAYSARSFAGAVVRDLVAGEGNGPWYSVGIYDNSFGFYTAHPMVLVAYRDELQLGLAINPERGVETIDEFVLRWVASESAAAFMQPVTYESMVARGLPMVLVARDARRVFVLRQRMRTSLL